MNIKLNQEVIVVGISNNARYDTQTYKGTVNKIGRKWFTINTNNYVGRDNQFSLEDGKCNGKGYSPEWQVFESEDIYKEVLETPNLRNKVERSLSKLPYKQLEEVSAFINSFSAEK